MFEAEYKRMMDNVTPDTALIESALNKSRPSQASTLARRRIRPLLVIMLIAAGILGASALAINGIRVIDWAGNIDKNPTRYASQKSMDETTQKRIDTIESVLRNMPDNEFWVITIDGHRYMSEPAETFTSFDAMKQRIKNSDLELLVPSNLPEGYMFSNGEMRFYLSEAAFGKGIPILSVAVTGDGMQIEKYKLPDNIRQYISHYHMHFTNAEGNSFNISCERTENSSYSSFTLWEGETNEVVTVSGMNKSIYITDNNHVYPNQLNLRKSEMTPRRYFPFCNPLNRETLNKEKIPAFFYEAAEYSLEASDIDKDELITIAESFQ